jgi:hypothetical protein
MMTLTAVMPVVRVVCVFVATRNAHGYASGKPEG